MNNRIDELLQIGERKIKNDITNSNRAQGIHSIRTAQTYRNVANSFGCYLKGQGIRSIDSIAQADVQGYMQSRQSLSAYTLSKDLAAINKLLDTRYTPKEFGFKNRSHSHIINNRGLAIRDTSQAIRNQEQLEFIRATGIRRQSIATVTPSQCVRNNKTIIGFSVIEKGGRERNCIVLEQDRQRITELVNQRELEAGANTPIFKQVDSNANPHYARREYAQQLYADLRQATVQGYDYYNGLRSVFINQKSFDRAISRYNNQYIKGFERDILAEVSQNMGHNRIDVIIYHYLI